MSPPSKVTLYADGMIELIGTYVSTQAVRVEAPCGTMPGRLVVELVDGTGVLEEIARTLARPITQRAVSEHDPIRARVAALEAGLEALAKSIEDERHHQHKRVTAIVDALNKRLDDTD